MLSLHDIIRIEQYFGVSHQSAIYRLMHTPYFNNNYADEYLNIPVRRLAVSLGYSSDLYKSLPKNRQYMTYGNYIMQAEQLISKELISYGKYEELLLDAFRVDLVYGDDDEEGDMID